MSNPSPHQHLAREKIVQRYLTALEDGDFSAIDAIWLEASRDAALEQLLFNLHEIFPQGRELFASGWHASTLLEEEKTVFTKEINTLNASQPPTRPQRTGRRRGSSVVRALAALLLVVCIVGGFLLVHTWNDLHLAKPNLTRTVTPATTPKLTQTPLAQIAALCPATLPTPYQTQANLNDVLVLSQNNVWIVGNAQGQALALHWDGAQWTSTPVPAPTGSSLSSLAALSPTDMWAVGETDYGSGVANGSAQPSHTLIEHWDGTRWSKVASPDLLPSTRNELHGIAVLSSNDVWVVGAAGNDFTKSGYGANTAPLLEHWNGTRWQLVTLPSIQGAGLNSIVALNANDMWAAGTASENNGNDHFPLLLHWNGQNWSQLAQQDINGGGQGQLLQITADASHHLWALGFDQNGLPLLLNQSSGSWVSFPVPPAPHATSTTTAYNQFWSISATSPQDLWLAGEVVQTPIAPGASTFAPLVEHWDGHQWQLVSEHYQGSGNLQAIAVSAGTVWASGAVDVFNSPLIFTTCR